MKIGIIANNNETEMRNYFLIFIMKISKEKIDI